MADSRPERMHEQELAPALISDDPVLLHLGQAQLAYQEARARAEFQTAALRDAQSELTRARAAATDLERSLQESERRLTQEKDEVHHRLTREKDEAAERHARELEQQAVRSQEAALQQRERADKLAEVVKSLYGSLFSGDVYELILKACMIITGASRGLYVTSRGEGKALRIRAAVEVDGYPQASPSAYIAALACKALGGDETYACNAGDDWFDLPRPASGDETFRNVVVAPVVLLKNLDGVMIVADKREGDFEQGDVEALLSVGDQASVAVENAQLRRELQKAYLGTVGALADAMEAKDAYTHGHCDEVARLARLTAERLHLSDYDRSVVTYAALLHDVGKIGVSDGILNKPGPLLPEERALMHSHVRVGRDLIAHVPALSTVADAVMHHHEWYDGTGYPDGLAGEGIPIASRIVGAVDAYCAMIAKRSYKDAYSEEQARAELTHCAGVQFDPRVVEVLLDVLGTPEAYEVADEDEDDEDLLLPGFARIAAFEHAAHGK